MTSEDYFNWAAECHREVEAIEHRISVKELEERARIIREKEG